MWFLFSKSCIWTILGYWYLNNSFDLAGWFESHDLHFFSRFGSSASWFNWWTLGVNGHMPFFIIRIWSYFIIFFILCLRILLISLVYYYYNYNYILFYLISLFSFCHFLIITNRYFIFSTNGVCNFFYSPCKYWSIAFLPLKLLFLYIKKKKLIHICRGQVLT